MRRRSRLALILAAALLAAPSRGLVPGVTYLGSFEPASTGPQFGGFSAIDVAPDGLNFVALSDRSGMVRGTFRRDAGGRITGADFGPFAPLAVPGGPRIGRKSPDTDAEGIAVAPDGTLFISFEGHHRIERRRTDTTPPEDLPLVPAFLRLPRNGGLEALAVDGGGALYTLPERGRLPDGSIPVFRLDVNGWTLARSVPGEGRFRPVGADIGPDGRLYLLERRATVPFGFATRVRRMQPTGSELPETVLETGTGQHDNLEGISVWTDTDGVLRLTMIADDNFMPFQRSEIVEYRLSPGLALSDGGR